MDPPHPPPSSGPRETVRFAIFEEAEGRKIDIARITLSKSDTGRWTAQISGEADAHVSKVKSILDRYAEAKQSTATTEEREADNPPDWGQLIDTFGQEGYLVEKLPAGDFQFEFQYDQKSGRFVASQRPLHEFATTNSVLIRDIISSLSRTFRNISDDLAEEIDHGLSSGAIDETVASVRRAYEGGKFGFAPNPKLLDALVKIDVTSLSPADRKMVRDLRIALAENLKKYDVAGSDAEALLAGEDGVALSGEQKYNLQIFLGLATMKRGNRETALMIWRSVLGNPAALHPATRAWTWRNISLALSSDDPESLRAIQYAADAFLEAGNRHEACQSLMQLAKRLMGEDPIEAIKKIDEILFLLDREGLGDKNLRSAALHTRANRLSQLGKHSEALVNAREAVDLRRGVIGTEAEFVSSLYLGSTEADLSGLHDEAATLKDEADRLSNQIDTPRFRLGRQIENLFGAFDSFQSDEILREAKSVNDWDVVASVRIVQAVKDTSLSDIGRLELLEESLRELDQAGVREEAKLTTWFAIGHQLLLMGQFERAESWYRKILAIAPLDVPARNELLHCQWKHEKWGDAAILLRRIIKLWGEKPGLMLDYGKSLIEAGDLSGAISVLTKAADLAGGNEALKSECINLRERALQSGAIPSPIPPIEELTAPITREEFQSEIQNFARFVKSEQRMGFWKKDDGKDYEWIGRPEQHAKVLLHTFLKAKFGDRIMVFQEVATGAGRLDLYVQLHGGMAIILELKMCGFGYSSGYASAGEDQILHYMENRTSSLGYLIVFDARLNNLGQKLLQRLAGDRFTVIETIIDVTPRVSFRPYSIGQ